MSFAVQTIDYFDTEARRLKKRYRSFADDLEAFKNSIKKNPYQGTELSPGIRKVRMAIGSKDKGSSKGARVITFTYAVSEKLGIVTLLLIYDKSDASSIKMNVVKAIVKDLGFDVDKMQEEGMLKPLPLDTDEQQSL